MITSVIKLLDENGIEFSEHGRLDVISHMKAGGTARVIALPKTTEELILVVKASVRENVRYSVIGRMSNTLPLDGEYNGIVVDTSKLTAFSISDSEIKAECGVRLSRLIWRMAKCGLSGLDELFMIPASVGGAIYNNAGAHGKTISDALVDARVYSPSEDSIKLLSRDELKFGYRHSVFMDENYVLLSARFKTYTSDFQSIKQRIQDMARIRRSAQPLEYPSLGSIFKRCSGQGAGYYIERAGLKGMKIGDAEVSQKHAGFIINTGKATAEDVIRLIEYVKGKVFESFGVKLEEEIEII